MAKDFFRQHGCFRFCIKLIGTEEQDKLEDT